jgi:hypothetical protein
MHLLKRVVLILVCSIFYFNSYSQNDSCHLKISLLTCGPGEDLYSIFGHSGLRVRDTGSRTDIVYNYGTFDFNEEFYIKFVLGKLRYFVAPENFADFMQEYTIENRSVIEQELNLTCSEKTKLYAALRNNSLEQNKYYLYQFLFDNCSTRLRDIVKHSLDDSLRFKNILPKEPPTFRDMIHVCLENGGQYWSEFGIDLLLASRIDRKVKNEEAMFLPDYLMKGFDSAVIRNAPLVTVKKTILPQAYAAGVSNAFPITPLMTTSLLLIIGVGLLFIKSPRAQKANDVFDNLYFLILGIIGCLILFMWFGTDHELCRDNYNLFWALPAHIVFAFLVYKKRPLAKKYFRISAIICTVFVVVWMFLPQGMNIAFLPMVMLAGIRSASRMLKN